MCCQGVEARLVSPRKARFAFKSGLVCQRLESYYVDKTVVFQR